MMNACGRARSESYKLRCERGSCARLTCAIRSVMAGRCVRRWATIFSSTVGNLAFTVIGLLVGS